MMRRFVPLAVLSLGVLLISGIREQIASPPRKSMSALATQFAGLEGRDVTVPEDERRVAGMSDYVMREFGKDSSSSFTIYVGYYDRQVQGKSIHSPKNCLPGAGWEILSSEKRSLPAKAGSGTINRVLLVNRGVRALVYYWYQGRGRIEASEYRVKLNLLVDAARYGRTEEALVRVVVPVAPWNARVADTQSLADADALAIRLVSDLAPAVRSLLPDAPGSAPASRVALRTM